MTDSSAKILVLNGPNLNLLGSREPEIYGRTTLKEIETTLATTAAQLGVSIECKQSNHEGDLVDWLQEASLNHAKAVILNAGGYTHSSVALRDAIASIQTPVIEVHLSNLLSRESFRHISLISAVSVGTIQGFGVTSYTLALHAAVML